MLRLSERGESHGTLGVTILNCLPDLCSDTAHDRIPAREPTHDIERWSVWTIEHISERDGHGVFEVRSSEGEPVELIVTVATRELVSSRLDLDERESPVSTRVWYLEHGG